VINSFQFSRLAAALPLSCFLTILAPTDCGTAFAVAADVPKQLDKLLAKESRGEYVDRRASLNRSLSDSAPEAVKWHAGEIQIGGDWIPISRISEAASSEETSGYLALRRKAPLNLLAHRKLAKYCESNKLPKQARAHWSAVLADSPKDPEARLALGHELVRGTWFTPDEIEQADRNAKKLERDWQRWMPKVRKVVAELTAENISNQKRGLANLEKIDDPAAVSSLSMAALQLPESHAVPFVKAIAKHRDQNSCLALVRIALTFPTDARGDLAVKSIASYPFEFYVPELLGLIVTPIQTELITSVNSRGELLIQRAMFRETSDERQRLRMERLVRTTQLPQSEDRLTIRHSRALRSVAVLLGGVERRSPLSFYLKLGEQEYSDEVAAAGLAKDDENRLDSEIAIRNLLTTKQTAIVSSLLSRCTGEPQPNTPQQWWDWWQDYNYQYATKKPLRDYVYSTVDKPVAEASEYYVRYERHSCLSAGTQIATARGMRPIEEIQIGDLVPAQDVETGELALKPVLQTTVRPPVKLLKVSTEAGELKTTLGHRWFVSGKGWLMAVDLEPGMLLHDATGTTRIEHIEELSQKEKAYNLIVADFHTYFVGSSRVLSYDNAPPPISTRPVPGFGNLLAKSSSN